MHFVRLFVAIAVFAILHQEVRAQETNVCTEHDPAKLVAALAQRSGQETAALVPLFSRAPAGAPAELVLARPNDEKMTFRIVFQLGEATNPGIENVRVAENRDITAKPVGEKYVLKLSGAVAQGTTLLSFDVPHIMTGLSLWRPGAITVIACKADKIAFVGRRATEFSSRIPVFLLTAFVTLVLYVLVAYAVARCEDANRSAPYKLKWYRYLDPVVLSSGPNGTGSISRLQVLFFSVLLFSIVLYILLRVGLLSDMSETVLLLLGISGIGAAAAQGTDVKRQRLKFENWAWLIRKDWLPPNGIASTRVAQWREIVSGIDGFDVYRFQMLVFSLVVGIALLQVGFSELATFTIPAALLGVMGLSQVVYLGGKLVDGPAIQELDKALEELVKAESSFADYAAANNIPEPDQPTTPPTSTVATLGQYRAFSEQRKKIETMFESLFGKLPDGAIKEPRYR
ncbi:MAG: hypothetical protein FD144_1933 [Rhodospirillaceae bacterium]|nr:MAG: hypothetical protein FD144_1933 [Rhodospirillaceae bacterium]